MSATLSIPRRGYPVTRWARVRWAGAFIFVAALHAAAGVAWLMRLDFTPPEQPPVTLIDLEPAPAPEPPKPVEEPKPAEEPPPPAPPPPAPRVEEPPPQPAPEPPPPDTPPPPEPPSPEPPPPEPPPPEPPAPEPPPPQEAPPPPVQPPPPPPDVPAVALPPPPPVPPPPPRPAPQHPHPVPRPMPRPVVQPPAPQPVAAPTAPPVVAPAVPTPRNVAPPATWQARLFAHLARYKRYPPEAQMRHQEGTPLVRIVMDRVGRVLSYRLERGSGFALLDEEAQALIRRAQPLPALPDDVTAQTIEIVVPLNFRVR